MVITASAARTTSSVSGFGNSCAMSTPTSRIASTTAGLIRSAGSEPADRTWIRPPERPQPLARKAVHQQREVGRDPRSAEQVARLLDVAGNRLGREGPGELFVQLLRCMFDLVARDRVEHLGHRLLLEIDDGRSASLPTTSTAVNIVPNMKP